LVSDEEKTTITWTPGLVTVNPTYHGRICGAGGSGGSGSDGAGGGGGGVAGVDAWINELAEFTETIVASAPAEKTIAQAESSRRLSPDKPTDPEAGSW
jgi:hypothetical protein